MFQVLELVRKDSVEAVAEAASTATCSFERCWEGQVVEGGGGGFEYTWRTETPLQCGLGLAVARLYTSLSLRERGKPAYLEIKGLLDG